MNRSDPASLNFYGNRTLKQTNRQDEAVLLLKLQEDSFETFQCSPFHQNALPYPKEGPRF